MSTAYHAKYFAHELTRRGMSGETDRLSMALFDACVDLNPHQIEAALFALRSPISKGVLLADEVGLGKTIEAGLVLCQYWAERRRRLLVICPASIRKQWAMELQEKFNLPSVVLDAATFNDLKDQGQIDPFESAKVVITSFHYAARNAQNIRRIGWDVVVIDEAHKLRNAYRESNRMGQAIRWALEGKKKVLLTATPLQNSLMELYGLASIIDDNLFGGDAATFRTQYANVGGDLDLLRQRIQPWCKRTLRRQVLSIVKYRASHRSHKPQNSGTIAMRKQTAKITMPTVAPVIFSPHSSWSSFFSRQVFASSAEFFFSRSAALRCGSALIHSSSEAFSAGEIISMRCALNFREVTIH